MATAAMNYRAGDNLHAQLNGRVGAIYNRSSRDDGDETFSIDSQLKRNAEYKEKHGISVPEENVIEDEVTGFTLNRPGFNKIMRLIESGMINCLIVYKVNRIARKSHLADYFLQEVCFTNNVELHIVEWGRPVQNKKDDLLLFGLQAQFSQFDAMDIKERTMRGRREKAEQNIWLGQGETVYGYRKEGTRKNTVLRIVEEEANVIRLIFHLFVNEGVKINDIVRLLNAQDKLSPSQSRAMYRIKTGWRMNSVFRIIRDTRYTGVWHSYKFESHRVDGEFDSRGRARRTQSLRDQEDWLQHEFPDLAIVDKDTFEAAQAIIDSRKDRYTFEAKYEYLFARRLTCICSHRVAGTTYIKQGELTSFYRCDHRRRHGPETCDLAGYLRTKEFDAAAWELIEKLLRNPKIELDLLRQVQAQQKEKHSDVVMNLEAIEVIRQRHRNDMKARYRDYKDGLLTRELYLEEKAELDIKLQAAEALYTEYQSTVDQRVLTDEAIQRISTECRKFADYLDAAGELTFEHKRALVELLDITGRLAIEDGYLVLYLSIHSLEFDKLSVHEHQGSESSAAHC